MINVQISQCGAEYQIKRIVPQSGGGRDFEKAHIHEKNTLDVFLNLTKEKQET